MMTRILIALLIGLGPLSIQAPAEGTEKTPPTLTKEERETRAVMHEKMAECLRSDKTLTECHEQMHKDCPMADGAGSCPMMEGMKRGKRGKMKGLRGGMTPSETTPDQK